jgi:hypothetical protein
MVSTRLSCLENGMLGKSDRLRILCTILDLDMEQFLDRLVKRRPEDDRAVLRDQVRKWWEHRHQPTKNTHATLAVLDERAQQAGKSLDVNGLWRADKTLGEFVDACGTTVESVLPVLSPASRRAFLEPIERLPFLKLMHEEFAANSDSAAAAMRRAQGFYHVYRIHSSDRTLCRETVWIGPQSAGITARARYVQYVEGDRRRTIELSLLISERWLHAIGAYRDEAFGHDMPLSMVHATIFSAPHRTNMFAGVLLDVTDNKTAVAAQRILLVKQPSMEAATMDHVRVITDPGADTMAYENFLRTQERDDKFLLTAEQRRMSEMLG